MNKPITRKFLIEVNLNTGLFYLTTSKKVFKSPKSHKILDQLHIEFNSIYLEIEKIKKGEVQEDDGKDVKKVKEVRKIWDGGENNG